MIRAAVNLAAIFLISGLFSGGAAVAAEPGQKPNIVLILADDLGFGDLKCYGHPYSRTPNLDKLASEGTKFTRCYATGVTCCPSRTGFMSGKFPATYHVYPANGGFGKRITVSELLKTQGYRTGHFGKWHIGPDRKMGTYGFDQIGSEHRERAKTDRPRDAAIFDDAIQFIEKNKSGPFYVNVWSHATHFPVNPPQAYLDKFKDLKVKVTDFSPYMQEKFAQAKKLGGNIDQGMQAYLAEVLGLDEGVGRLLKKLDELGLRENTIVVFSSDQGPAPVRLAEGEMDPIQRVLRLNMLGYAGFLRGGKHEMYEGGVRIPFVLRWPGHVKAGAVDEKGVISGIDWLPTLCDIAGAKIDAKEFDGENVSDIWLGKERARTKPILWKTSSIKSAIGILDGKWKLYHPNRKKGEIELFDLSVDERETKNIAQTNPMVVRELTAKVMNWNATLPKDYIKTKDKDN
jgi:N-acetylgalactosamine-6-sulfatase